MKGNRTDLGIRVRDFFDRHPRGEYSTADVAQALGVSPNTVGQYLLTLAEGGELTRRMQGIARGRKYVYTKAPGVEIKLDTAPARPDVRDMRVIGWYDLPTWVKGSLSSRVEYAKQCTWLRTEDEVFYCFGPEGTYKGTWAHE